MSLLEAAAPKKKRSPRTASPSARLRARLLGGLVSRGGFTYNGRSYLVVGAKKKSRPRRRLAEGAAPLPPALLRLLPPSAHEQLLTDVLEPERHGDAADVRGGATRRDPLIEASRVTLQDAQTRAAHRYFSREARDERAAETLDEILGLPASKTGGF